MDYWQQRPRVKALFERACGQQRDVEVLLRAAEVLDLFPLVYRTLSHQDLPKWAQRSWRGHLARVALLRRGKARLLAALVPLPVVQLKGAPMAQELFGDPYVRRVTDIDLLLSRRDIPEAIRRSSALGFQYELEYPVYPWASNQLSLHDEPAAAAVELHWALAMPHVPSPKTGCLLARRVQGPEGPVLCPQDQLFLLALHAHQHRGALKTLFDLAAWLDCYGASVSWPRIELWARKSGVLGLVAWSLRAIELASQMSSPWRPSLGWQQRGIVELYAHKVTRAIPGAFATAEPSSKLRFMLHPDALGEKLGAGWNTLLSSSLADSWPHRIWGGLRFGLLGPHRLGRALLARRPDEIRETLSELYPQYF